MDLLKEKYQIKFIEKFAPLISKLSINSASSCMLILKAVSSNFYETDLANLVNKIEKNLFNNDFVPCFEDTKSVQSFHNHSDFEWDWFIYYYSRLPILMRYNTFRHKGKKCRFDFDEIEFISTHILNHWYARYEKDGLCKGLLSKAVKSYFFTQNNICRWYVSKKKKDDYLYDSNWLWESFNKNYSMIISGTSSNVVDLVCDVFNGSFPMYWNCISEYYVKQMIYAAQLGYFIGDSDIKEIIKRGQESS